MGRRIVISIETLQFILVFSLFCLIALTGTKVFEPWPQVTALWDYGSPLVHLIDHFHFERYLASYPGLYLEERYPDVGFSIYIAFVIAVNTLLFRRVHKGFTGFPPSSFSYAIFLLAHLAMNGRGPIGWLGWLLALYLHARFIDPDRTGPFLTLKNSCLLLLTFLLSSVSSGVFLVVFMANTLLIVRILKTSKRVQKLTLLSITSGFFAFLSISYVIYKAAVFGLDAILKIYLFFGSYTEVISHGIGILSKSFDAIALSLIATVMLISFIFLWRFLKAEVTPVLWILFTFSMVGGAFGFTTLTLNIPIFLIFFSTLLLKIFRQSKLRLLSS